MCYQQAVKQEKRVGSGSNASTGKRNGKREDNQPRKNAAPLDASQQLKDKVVRQEPEALVNKAGLEPMRCKVEKNVAQHVSRDDRDAGPSVVNGGHAGPSVVNGGDAGPSVAKAGEPTLQPQESTRIAAEVNITPSVAATNAMHAGTWPKVGQELEHDVPSSWDAQGMGSPFTAGQSVVSRSPASEEVLVLTPRRTSKRPRGICLRSLPLL